MSCTNCGRILYFATWTSRPLVGSAALLLGFVSLLQKSAFLGAICGTAQDRLSGILFSAKVIPVLEGRRIASPEQSGGEESPNTRGRDAA